MPFLVAKGHRPTRPLVWKATGLEGGEKVTDEDKIKLPQNAIIVLRKRYLTKDNNGNPVEEPAELFHRVANEIAKADLNYDNKADVQKIAAQFYQLLSNLEFLPNSPTLMNAGRALGQLSACFVLPVEDSMDSIFDTLKNTALIHKSGGGTGFDFSHLRPKGSVVKSTSGVASGPISFMTAYNAATETIKQGGTRRGANMGILRVDHPDILEFITCKDDVAKLNNFNISVAITDEFMKAVEKNKDFDLVDPISKKAVQKLNAQEVFDKIVEQAWKNGEPGIIFIDKINDKNPTPALGKIESTNPCGEQPLLPYESCNLGSINLGVLTKRQDSKKVLDWKKLEDVVTKAVHFLDNVIDLNRYPLDEIKEMTLGNRKIGLGVMGFADLLIKLQIPYNSQQALEIGEKIMAFINDKGHEASEKLAEKRGAFPNFKQSIYFQRKRKKIRNATITTIAPTGTISIIANASSGIEPLFAVCYSRQNILDGEKMWEVHPEFERVAKKEGFYSQKLLQEAAQKGSIQSIDEIPQNIKNFFITAHDITPEDHIKMQTVFQKHTDNAVSKTVNFPNSANIEGVKNVYLQAYKYGCKGVTIYRDGSRPTQVLNLENKKEQPKVQEQAQLQIVATQTLKPKPRPTVMRGWTHKIDTAYGNLYITLNEDDKGNLFEVFTSMGKAGGFFATETEAISRLISLALRSGISPEAVIKQIKGIRGPLPSWNEGQMILSLPDAIGQIIEKHLKKEQPKLDLKLDKQDETKENENTYAKMGLPPECPECGSILEISEGCIKCRVCGFSRC